MEVLSILGDIIFSVISTVVYEQGKGFIEEQKTKARINQWLNDFFSTHKEKVFELSQFSNYVVYQKPLTKISEYVFDTDNFLKSNEQTFIFQLASECKTNIIQGGGKCSVTEESSIRDLFYGVLELYKKILREKTSSGDKLILYQLEQSSITTKKTLQNYDSKIDDLKELLGEHGKITNYETIEKIYIILSNELWNGHVEDVYKIYQGLSGKNDDLESAIKIRLAVLSDYNVISEEPSILCSRINNPIIRDDLCRLFILEYFETPNKLCPYIDLISDETLKKIAVAVKDKHLNEIISVKKVKYNYTFEVTRGLEAEDWLIKRLCALVIYSLNVSNATIIIKKLIDTPNIIDQLLIWEHYFDEVSSLSIDGKYPETQEFRNYVSEMKEHRTDYIHVRLDIKKRFYQSLLRGMSLISDSEIKKVFDSLSEQGITDSKIEAYKLEEEINEGKAEQDRVIDFVLSTKEYRILVLYGQSLNNYEKESDIINQVNWLIGKSIIIFQEAINCTYHVKGKEEAFELIKKYELQYSDYAEFWVSAYSVSVAQEDRQWIVNSVITKIQEGKLLSSIYYQIQISIILIKEGKFTDAIELLSSIERSNGENEYVSRLKIEAYIQSERQIDALTEIVNHYELLKKDVQILDLLLSISLSNKRPISEEVLSDAKKFDNPRILMLIAEAEYVNENIAEARKFAMRSMLESSPENEELFDTALKYFTDEDKTSIEEIRCINENTFFVMENQCDHTCLSFCIYKDRILPTQELFWKDAWHISIEEAINKGFLRLRVGDAIVYNNNTFKINSIAPINAFYFRICMDSMIQRNRAWTISGQNAEELVQGIISMSKEHPNFSKQEWNKLYSDFSQIAIPLYWLKGHSPLEYGQLVRTIMDDPNMIVREYIMPLRLKKNKEYILTYSTLIELHKLGINPLEFYENIKIPFSAISESEHEAEIIYKRNNKDTVASMAVEDGKVFMFEATEADKRENVQQAVDFKKYVSSFPGVGNTKDLTIEEWQSTNIIQLIGICDYDAVSLAYNRGSTLITGEMMISALTKLDTVKTEVAGIVDFLCLIEMPITKLFEAIKRMINYRFYAVVTPTLIKYIAGVYDKSDETEKIEIIKKWKDILEMPEKLKDKKYRDKFKVACWETLRLLSADNFLIRHPIIDSFNMATFYYNDYRIQFYREDGKINYRIVQLDSVPGTESKEKDQ